MSWNAEDKNADTITDSSPDVESTAVLGRIDQYELLKELGTGGFGSVYLARDTTSRTFVAVKGLPAQVKDSEDEMANIRENFALVSKLHHENIAAALVLHPASDVRYTDVETARKLNVQTGQVLMVMQYAPGVTLTKWRKQFPGGKVPLEKTVEVTRQIAAALSFAHRNKIIHRDVKPANIMVETAENGAITARVLDFGLAAEVRSSMNRTSQGGVTDKSGTRQYMSPEQWKGLRQGAASDQYALAVLFYELVTGEIPFSSAFDCGDPIVMLTAVTTQEPDIPEDLPKPVRQALARALAKKAEDRFASCGDFVAVLEGKKPPFGKKPLLAACAAALLLSVFGVWWFLGGGQKSVPSVPPVPSVPVARPAPAPAPSPVDGEVERRRLELAAESAAYALATEMEAAAQRIAAEPADVRSFFETEIHAFEKLRKSGDKARADARNVTATNFFAQAKAGADALKRLVDARGQALAARQRAEVAKRSADAVDASSALAMRYAEASRALDEVSPLVEKRRFAEASERAEAARGRFAALRADVVKVALDRARKHGTAGRWQECLDAAEKVLCWEPGNAEAAELKAEANRNLEPTLRLVAHVDGREVKAKTQIDGENYETPLSFSKLTEGRAVGGFQMTFMDGGRKYVGAAPRWTIDWKGPRTMRVELTEYKEPAAGDTRTITLPGGAKVELVWCPPGSFMMGSPTDEDGRFDDETQHRVTLTTGFWIGKYEVTQEQWQSVMGSNPSHFKGANLPVEKVSWDDCQAFCRKAGRGLRLPTEAEWEYACRAGMTKAYFWGDSLNGDRANCDGNYPCGTTSKGPYREKTCGVGSYAPNAWGLYDMHGNVSEWCSDWYGSYGGEATNPTGPASGEDRVNRGGSWFDRARYCRSALRSRRGPARSLSFLGFRLCCSAGPYE